MNIKIREIKGNRVYSDIEYVSTEFTPDDLFECFGEKYMNLPINERKFFEWLFDGDFGFYRTVVEKGDSAVRFSVNFGDVVVQFSVKRTLRSPRLTFHTWYSLRRKNEVGNKFITWLNEMRYVKQEKSLDDLDLATNYIKRISPKDAKMYLSGVAEYINARESAKK